MPKLCLVFNCPGSSTHDLVCLKPRGSLWLPLYKNEDISAIPVDTLLEHDHDIDPVPPRMQSPDIKVCKIELENLTNDNWQEVWYGHGHGHEGTRRLFDEEVLVDLKNCDITTLEQFQTYGIFPQERLSWKARPRAWKKFVTILIWWSIGAHPSPCSTPSIPTGPVMLVNICIKAIFHPPARFALEIFQLIYSSPYHPCRGSLL